jgi:hypothetical protein
MIQEEEEEKTQEQEILIQSVLDGLYENYQWPDTREKNSHVISFINNDSNSYLIRKDNRSSYIKINLDGTYKIGSIYYGTNNPDNTIRMSSLFLKLLFVGYSSIDNYPIFGIASEAAIKAILGSDSVVTFVDAPHASIADIFYRTTPCIVNNILNDNILDIISNKSEKIISCSMVRTIEDHIQGYIN